MRSMDFLIKIPINLSIDWIQLTSTLFILFFKSSHSVGSDRRTSERFKDLIMNANELISPQKF